MEVLRLETDKMNFASEFAEEWIRLNTVIGYIDISEENGNLFIRAKDGKLVIIPEAANTIKLNIARF